MKCPVCVDTRLVISERQAIEIDYCPECRGVWLDRGELDKIIQRSSTQTMQSKDKYNELEAKQHSRASRTFGYHKKKKSGGLLGELFDF